jgi:peroxiredoxin Q/BCP
MAQLRQESDRLTKLDIEVLVVGPENSDSFRKYWKKESLPFKGLPDPNHSVLKLYGQEVKILKLGRMPAQMLIDKSGILKFVYYGNSMVDIPDLSELEKALSSR